MLPARPPRRIPRNLGIPESPGGGQDLYSKHWIKRNRSTSMLAEKVRTDKLGSQTPMMPAAIKLTKPKNPHMLALPPLSAQNKSSSKLNFVELNKRL